MKNLLFDFIVDKDSSTVFVNREFAADISLVWDAFTKQEILDQWWAPQPWVSKTIKMDFKEGGQRFYAMVGPEGQEHYSIELYTLIKPQMDIHWESYFADKDENINKDFPSSEWELKFSEQRGICKVNIVIKHKTLADLEMHIQMGFKEGFTATLNYLENLLLNLNN
ncbi:MAG: Activator of Hsp90 ATPase 1 family protein [Bacteroidetes bacterium OLB9]|nr:MAG: Activator of Hsp90 ATPase 1 family protein [Bacteroidetes bacterium OLB9]